MPAVHRIAIDFDGCRKYANRASRTKQSRSGNNFAFSIDSLCFIIFEESRGSRITPAKLGPHFELEKTPVAV